MNSLEKAGFVEMKPARKPLVLLALGQTKHGKSRFGLSAANEGPVAYLDADRGVDEVALQMNLAHPIYREEFRWGARDSETAYAKDWDLFKQRHCEAVRGGASAVVWDTVSKAYLLSRMAVLGAIKGVRQTNYDEVYSQINSLIFTVQDERDDCDFIMLCQLKPEYAEGTGGFSQKTGNFVPDCPRCVKEAANCTVRLEWDGQGGAPENYGLTVQDCRPNPSLIGLELKGEMAAFPTLKEMIFS